jgi:hypothetical protein
VAGIRLYERVIDALLFKPGQQEMSQFVRRQILNKTGFLRIFSQNLSYSPIGIFFLPRGKGTIRSLAVLKVNIGQPDIYKLTYPNAGIKQRLDDVVDTTPNGDL